MITKSIKIINKLGLHARASAKFVTVASKYVSKIDVKHADKTVNGKSIMGIMMLAAKQGTVLEITLDGSDEKEMIAAIETVINNRFGEAE